MIETRDGTRLRPRPKDIEHTATPGLFLRFESTRERIALPYALLLKMEMSSDQRTLELGFATHAVKVEGRDLSEIYLAVAEGHARCIRLSNRETHGVTARQDDDAVVSVIRITRLDPEDRKRQ